MELADNRLKRLYFRSMHRGCKETDLLLGGFAKRHLAALSPELIEKYEAFLEEQDWSIWGWVNGDESYNPAYAPLIEILRREPV